VSGRGLRLLGFAAALTAGCAVATPYESHLALERLLESPEGMRTLTEDLGNSCVEWSRGGGDGPQRGARLYARTRDRHGLLDGEMAELVEREPQVRYDVERLCGKAFATEYFKRFRTGFRAPHEFEPTSNTTEHEPVSGEMRKEKVDTDIPSEDLRPKSKKTDPWE